jgi:hypothetical protein
MKPETWETLVVRFFVTLPVQPLVTAFFTKKSKSQAPVRFSQLIS